MGEPLFHLGPYLAESILNGFPVLRDGVAQLHHSALRGITHIECVGQVSHIVRKGQAGVHHVLISGHDGLVVVVASGLFEGSLVLPLHGRDPAHLPSHAGQCAVHAHQGRHGPLCRRSPGFETALAVLLHSGLVSVCTPRELAVIVKLVQQVHPLLCHGDAAVVETRKVVERRKLSLVQFAFQFQLFLLRFQIVQIRLLGHAACFAEGILRFHPRLFREGGLLALDGQPLVDGLDVPVALLGHGSGLLVGVRPDLVFGLSQLVVAFVPLEGRLVGVLEPRLLQVEEGLLLVQQSGVGFFRFVVVRACPGDQFVVLPLCNIHTGCLQLDALRQRLTLFLDERFDGSGVSFACFPEAVFLVGRILEVFVGLQLLCVLLGDGLGQSLSLARGASSAPFTAASGGFGGVVQEIAAVLLEDEVGIFARVQAFQAKSTSDLLCGPVPCLAGQVLQGVFRFDLAALVLSQRLRCLVPHGAGLPVCAEIGRIPGVFFGVGLLVVPYCLLVAVCPESGFSAGERSVRHEMVGLYNAVKFQHLFRGSLLGFVQCCAHSVSHLQSRIIARIIELVSQVGVSDPEAQSLHDVPSVLFRQLTRRVDAPESRKDVPDALRHSLDRRRCPCQHALVANADGQTFRDVPADLFEDPRGAVDVIPLLGGIYGVVHHALYSTRCAGFVFLDALRPSVCDISTDLLTLFFGVVFCTGEGKDICDIDALGFEIGVELERHISLLEVSIAAEGRKNVPDAVPDVLSQLFQCALDTVAFAAFSAPCPADEVDSRLDEHLAQGGKGLADWFGALVDGTADECHHSHQSSLDVRRGVDDGRTQRVGKQGQCAEECACTGEVEHSLSELLECLCQQFESYGELGHCRQHRTAQ